MARVWEADPSALFVKRLGKSAEELGNSQGKEECPDIWQLSNGDIAVIGRGVGADERIVVIPGNMPSAAKPDIPDA